MLFLIFFISLIYTKIQQQQEEEEPLDRPITLWVLNHTNAYTLYPNTANKVMCQKIMDRLDHPLIIATDDVILPHQETWLTQWGIKNCSSATFSFTTIRTRNDLNPYNITLQLMRHDDLENRPGEIFFVKTLAWPTNNIRWLYDIIGIPSQNDITLEHGELADDGTTRFDLTDPDFLRPGTRMWVAFYVSLPWHMGQSLRTNSMYWVTLADTLGSSPIQSFPTGTLNRHFYYKDAYDLEKFGFRNWTDATIVSPYIGITPSTNQLAWSLSLQCTGVPPQPTIVPPPVTTTSPTLSEPPTEEDGPFIYNNTNQTNGTMGVTTLNHSLILGLTLPLLLLIIIILLVAVGCFIWRKKKRKTALQTDIKQRLSNFEQQAPNRNPLSMPKTGTGEQSFTNASHFRDVPLNNDSKYKALFSFTPEQTDDNSDEL
jgi:hypothetical protein